MTTQKPVGTISGFGPVELKDRQKKPAVALKEFWWFSVHNESSTAIISQHTKISDMPISKAVVRKKNIPDFLDLYLVPESVAGYIIKHDVPGVLFRQEGEKGQIVEYRS